MQEETISCFAFAAGQTAFLHILAVLIFTL